MAGSVASPPQVAGGAAWVAESGRVDFVAVQHSVEFVRLRRSYRRFVFPLCLVFFCWYLLYVLLAAYAEEFMAQRVVGQVNVGLVLGVAQFVSTGAITVLYLRFARRRIDPQVDALRAMVEGDPR